MKISELMNYRFENPTQDVGVDSKILEKYVARERTMEQSEFFASWASVSGESKKLLPIMQKYLQYGKDIQEQRQVGITR